jgi:hypothetical protein
MGWECAMDAENRDQTAMHIARDILEECAKEREVPQEEILIHHLKEMYNYAYRRALADHYDDQDSLWE